MELDELVKKTLIEYEVDLGKAKKKPVRTIDLDKQFISFCNAVYEHLDKIDSSVEDKIDSSVYQNQLQRDRLKRLKDLLQENGLNRFVENLVISYNELVLLLDERPKIRSIHVQKDSKQNVFRLLSDLLEKSFGFKYEYVNNVVGYKIIETKPKEVPPQRDLFEAVRFLVKHYINKRPLIKDKDGKEKSLVFEGLKNVTYFKEDGSKVKINLSAEFNTNFWLNIFHDVDTCRFNFGEHNVGAFLDLIDPHIHYLCIKPDRRERKAEDIPSPLCLAILHESEDKNGNKYLAVEGVFGTHVERIDLDNKEKERVYEYLFNCIIEYAYKSGRGLFFNLSFNTKHPSQGAFEFINYVAKRLGIKPFYICINLEKGEYRFNTEVYSKLEDWEKQYIKLELPPPENLDPPKNLDFSKVNQQFGDKRYSNIYFIENRNKAKHKRENAEKEYKAKVEEFIHRKLTSNEWKEIKNGKREDLEKIIIEHLTASKKIDDSIWEKLDSKYNQDDDFYCSWSVPKGNGYGKTLNYKEVKKLYKERYKRNRLKIVAFINAGILCLSVFCGLAFYNLTQTIERPTKLLEETIRLEDIAKPIKTICDGCNITEDKITWVVEDKCGDTKVVTKNKAFRDDYFPKDVEVCVPTKTTQEINIEDIKRIYLVVPKHQLSDIPFISILPISSIQSSKLVFVEENNAIREVDIKETNAQNIANRLWTYVFRVGKTKKEETSTSNYFDKWFLESACNELSIENNKELCELLGKVKLKKDRKERIPVEEQAKTAKALEDYSKIFCSSPTIEGLGFILENYKTGDIEELFRKVLTGECEEKTLLILLAYPCEPDYFDYLNPIFSCGSYTTPPKITSSYLLEGYKSIKGYQTTAELRARITLLARIGLDTDLAEFGEKRDFTFSEARKLYNLIVSGETSIDELKFSGKHHDIPLIVSFYGAQTTATENNEDEQEEEQCTSEQMFAENQIRRIAIVKLLASTKKGRGFLEKKFWDRDNEDEIEVITIGRYLYSLSDLYKKTDFLRRYGNQFYNSTSDYQYDKDKGAIYRCDDPNKPFLSITDCREDKAIPLSGCLYLMCNNTFHANENLEWILNCSFKVEYFR